MCVYICIHVNMCVCVCIYICMYTCIYIYIYLYIYIHIYIYIYIYMYIHINLYSYIYVYTYNLYKSMCTYIYTYILYMCIHVIWPNVHYRMTKRHWMPYLCRSLFAKEPYDYWLFCRNWSSTESILWVFANLYFSYVSQLSELRPPFDWCRHQPVYFIYTSLCIYIHTYIYAHIVNCVFRFFSYVSQINSLLQGYLLIGAGSKSKWRLAKVQLFPRFTCVMHEKTVCVQEKRETKKNVCMRVCVSFRQSSALFPFHMCHARKTVCVLQKKKTKQIVCMCTVCHLAKVQLVPRFTRVVNEKTVGV